LAGSFLRSAFLWREPLRQDSLGLRSKDDTKISFDAEPQMRCEALDYMK